MLKSLLKPVVKPLVDSLVPSAIYRLKPDSQYIIVVKDEALAQQILDGAKENLDQSKIPNILVIVADDLKILEITKPSKQS